MKRTVLYNPAANKGRGLENAKQLESKEPGDYRYEDITKIKDLAQFMAEEDADREIIFTGGDGTLNFVVNDLYGHVPERPLYFWPAGTGNDFINDLHKEKDCSPFPVNEYICGLPTVVIGDERRRFINALGYGLDGYCCEESDRLQALGKEKAYTMIAAEGILGKYRPRAAKVTVDGETREYKKVWMAPIMFGGYYGGGVLMGPSQDRKNKEHLVTSVVIHDISRIGAALLFLKITAGKGERYPKYLDYRVGKHVIVEYDSPTAAQIDGETRLGVKKAEVFAAEE
ncbi:MAG: diacylglycerol kinase family protein [Lachnospiraceae bacterium]|nr:diacylglycerol kinase family protein [Lachnospiraceae bacterium]